MGCTNSQTVQEAFKTPEQFLEKYELQGKLGDGAFATVFLAKDAITDNSVAVKIMKSNTSKRSDGSAREMYLSGALQGREHSFKGVVSQEQRIWKKVGQNAHCLRLIDIFQGPKLSFMVMEKCECNLMEKLQKMPELQENAFSKMVRQMLLGLAHLHGLNIVHRDLKPDNVLFNSQDTLKICDFGLAAVVPSRGKVKSVCGTPPYMAPEVVSDLGYDMSADMWSLGVLMYLVLFAKFPYNPKVPNGAAMKEAIRVGSPAPNFKSNDPRQAPASRPATEFARALLNRSASQRPTAEDAMSHPFIVEANKENGAVLAKKGLTEAMERTKDFLDNVDFKAQEDIQQLLQSYFPTLRKSCTAPLNCQTLEADICRTKSKLSTRDSFRHSTRHLTRSSTHDCLSASIDHVVLEVAKQCDMSDSEDSTADTCKSSVSGNRSPPSHCSETSSVPSNKFKL